MNEELKTNIFVYKNNNRFLARKLYKNILFLVLKSLQFKQCLTDLHVIVACTLHDQSLHVMVAGELGQGQQPLHAHRLINLINMKINLAPLQTLCH